MHLYSLNATAMPSRCSEHVCVRKLLFVQADVLYNEVDIPQILRHRPTLVLSTESGHGKGHC